MTRRGWWVLAVLYMAGLFALSSVPDDPRNETGISDLFPPPAVQNALHIPAYAGLSFLVWRGLRGRTPAKRAALLASGLATAYGALDEVHQIFVTGRTASVTDALANALGAFAVAAAVALRERKRAAGPRAQEPR